MLFVRGESLLQDQRFSLPELIREIWGGRLCQHRLRAVKFVLCSGHKSEQLSRGYGFVKFRHEEDAIAAHKALNKKELYGK